jgi:hypothetical protein
MITLATRHHALGGARHSGVLATAATLAFIGTTALGASMALAFDNKTEVIGLDGNLIKDMGAPPTGNPYAEDFQVDSGAAITDRLRGEGPALANEMTPPTGNPNAEGYDAAPGGGGDVLAGGDGVVQPGGLAPQMDRPVGGDLGGQLVATGRIDMLQMQDGGGAITLDNGETYVLNANEPLQADINEGALVTFAYNIEGDHKAVVGTPQILE